MIHPTALIDLGAAVAPDVAIGAFTIVHAGVHLGAGSTVGSHCELGVPTPDGAAPLYIGAGSVIRSHSVLYGGSSFGDGLRTGHRVTLREGLQCGRELQVGTLGDLQGDATIGDHVRLHSNVFVAKLSVIEDFVWIFPHVALTNDPHPPSDGHHVGVRLKRWAVVATMSVVLPGVVVGEGAVIGAHSSVNRDVPDGHLAVGSPARDLGDASRVRLRDGSGSAYPWRRHFTRGYPAEVLESWSGTD